MNIVSLAVQISLCVLLGLFFRFPGAEAQHLGYCRQVYLRENRTQRKLAILYISLIRHEDSIIIEKKKKTDRRQATNT